MKRDFYKTLLAWKQSGSRKPLILKGARQVGKTYILKEFGRNEYQEGKSARRELSRIIELLLANYRLEELYIG